MSAKIALVRLPARSIPPTYEELVSLYVPRPLHDEQDYAAAVEIMDWLAGHQLNRDQDDFLDAVTTFAEAYEARMEPSAKRKFSGLELLRHLLEANGLAVKDLGRLLKVDASVGSRILSGGRKLTPGDLRVLADRFAVPADVFIR